MKRRTRQAADAVGAAEAASAADQEWKQLLRLGEQLIEKSSPAEQCDLIAETVGQMLSAQARVWLSGFSYPLPGLHTLELTPALTGALTISALPEEQTIHTPPSPLAQQALDSRKTCFDPQAVGDDLLPDADRPHTAAAPMVVNETILGVVQVGRPEGPGFTEREISLLEGLVAHAATAMEVTRQEALKDWRYEQLNLVRSVSGQIASFTNLEELYNRVTQLIQETFDFYYVAIFSLDERHNILRFRGSAGHSPSAPQGSDFTVQIGEGIIGTVAANGEEIMAPNVHQESRYRHIDGLPETQSEVALPLKVENRVLGVLDFQSDALNAFHKNDMLVLRSLADTIALSIESTRLYLNLQRRAEQISTVFEISHALTSILDMDELLNEVVRLIHDRFNYPFVHVYTVHSGRRQVFYHVGTGGRSEELKQRAISYSMDDPLGLIPWVARNGRTYLANDVDQDPLYRSTDVPPHDTRAEMVVPLITGDEVLGVLDIQSREPFAFDENDRSLFEALAAPVAVAMRNANLYRSELWRRQVAESFRDVAHLVSINYPLNQLLEIMLDKLEAVLPCDVSAIWLVDEQYENSKSELPRLRLAAVRNLSPERINEVRQEEHQLAGSVEAMIDRAIAADRPVIRQPEDPLGPLGAAMGFQPDYSSIAAPMRANDSPLGLLTLAHHQSKRYGSESQAITATFASYAAVAILNARLYSEAQEQALISTMLLQIAEASQSITTMEDLLATMVRLTRLLVGVKKSAFLLWDDGSQHFELKAWYGFDPAGNGPYRLPGYLSGFTRLVEERTTLQLEDPVEEIGLPELANSEENCSYVMLPLLVRGEVIGAYLVGVQMAASRGDHTGFDPKANAILQGIAHQTAMTIDNLSLQEARQEEAYVTAALLQVAQAVVSSSDLNDTLDTVVHLLPILVGIDACAIYLWDSASQLFRPTQVHAETRREEEQLLARAYAPGEHILLDTVRQKGEMHLAQISDHDGHFEQWAVLDCQTYESLAESNAAPRGDWLLAYPLSMQGQVLGILLVRETTASPAFWERRLEIIHGIAQQASLAIQNDLVKQEIVENERIEREIRLARQIQETFLPETMPKLPRWELDLRWETAREVGGDFYDIFKLDGNRLGLVIADVSDKGLPAALYMTVTRTLIRANASGLAKPAQVLQEVNKLLVSDSTDSMFITAVYAILSLDTGELVYANAGHNRPLLYRSRKKDVEQLPKGGTALGILDDLQLEDHALQIRTGDALVLFTDGVTDAIAPDGSFFGEERLEAVLEENGADTIQNILEALDDALIEFRRGVPASDDITLLALRREPARRRNTK